MKEFILALFTLFYILIGVTGCSLEEMEDGGIKFKIEKKFQNKLDTKLGHTTEKPIEKVSPDVNLEKIQKEVIKKKIPQRPLICGKPSFQMCDEELRVMGVKITNKKRKYEYILTNGCSDTIGNIDGIILYSNNEYEIGDELTLTD